MASESGEPGSVTVSLPSDMEEWLDQQAADLDVDREQLLVQLLSSYRTAADSDGDLATAEDVSDVLTTEDVEPLVKRVLGNRLPELADAVGERVAADLRADLAEELRDDVASAVRDRLREELADDLRERIEAELDGPDETQVAELRAEFEDLEREYRETLEDVRKRVIQVKREADAKADAERTNDELSELERRVDALEDELDGLAALESVLDRLDDVEAELDRLDDIERKADRLEDVETELDGVESELAALRGEVSEVGTDRIEAIEADLEDAREKLQTVAYVVRDLRDAVADGAGQETVDRIKSRAAEEDLARAACGNCGEGVRIGLLTEPSCPHCDATLDGLEPSGRMFGLGKATLTVAAGLEAGEEPTKEDELDRIPTANRGDRR